MDIEYETSMSARNIPNTSILNSTAPNLSDHMFDELADLQVKTFNHAALYKATNSFEQNKFLGKGGFGQVFRAENLEVGLEVAAIKLLTKTDDRVRKKFIDEIKFLSKMDHVNIIKLIGYAIEPKSDELKTDLKLFLVYEYAESGSLAARLKDKSKTYPFKQRLKHLMDIAQGLRYLHVDHSLLHRDINPNNILLHFDVAKLCDFGLIKKTGSDSETAPIGTRYYMPPEMNRHDISEKTDIYAFGIVLLETITGLPVGKQNDPNYYLVTNFLTSLM